MKRIAVRCRDAVSRIWNRTQTRAQARALRPAVEGLEDRKLLSTANGGHWYYPDRITYSFVPDGTNIGGVPSNLFQAFNAVVPTAVWQAEFRKAAALWQQVAGFNIVEVPDNGAPVGGVGNQQGDPRFGDIRIGGTPMHPSYLGYSMLPPPINGGPDAGDIVMNTTQTWGINTGAAFDILSVAIHEFGHSLGMGHNNDLMDANMYLYYAWIKRSLRADDIGGIRNLYGPVPADPTANSTAASAIDLTPYISNGQVSWRWGYMTSRSNFEWYKITAASSTMKVTMQSTNLSSLSPELHIIDSTNMTAVASVYAQDVYGGTVTVAPAVVPGRTYYILAKAAQDGAGSTGAFGLLVNFGTSPMAPIAPPVTTVAQTPDQGVNGWMGQMTPEGQRLLRRFRRLQGEEHGREGSEDGHRHQPMVVNLGNGRQAYADVLKIRPRRHPRLGGWPARFRRA